MVSIISLWLPILLAAVLVFVISFIIHTFLPYHRSDLVKVPSEDEAMDALRKLNISPGDYIIPYAGSTEAMRSPEFKEKLNKGPSIIMTVMKSGPTSMGGSLGLWFLYSVVVGIFAAYIAGHALGPGAHFRAVSRYAGCVAFSGYSLALLHDSIWYKRKWCTTFKLMFDGLIYALVTAAVFGWLWPAAA
jgi:hypothetical protein